MILGTVFYRSYPVGISALCTYCHVFPVLFYLVPDPMSLQSSSAFWYQKLVTTAVDAVEVSKLHLVHMVVVLY